MSEGTPFDSEGWAFETMKMLALQMTTMACGLSLAASCAEQEVPRSTEEFNLGAVLITEVGAERPTASTSEDYARLLLSADYRGASYLRVRKTEFDITDTSAQASPHTVRVFTASDSELFTTWDGLRTLDTDRWCCESWDEPPRDDVVWEEGSVSATSVTLGFPAIVSSTPVPHNGILEIEPESPGFVTATWEVEREGELLTGEVVLPSEDPDQASAEDKSNEP
jgi:hypothetical protein